MPRSNGVAWRQIELPVRLLREAARRGLSRLGLHVALWLWVTACLGLYAVQFRGTIALLMGRIFP